jgi:aromatic ring-opening dioxygenase catalytic subunit (LigB family)
MPRAGYPWAEEFDHKVKKAVAEHDVDSLSAPDRSGGSRLAGPTLEHHAPILYCPGSTDERDRCA